MPANATTLKYSPVVAVTLENQEINFADAELDGHRVQLNVPASQLNAACKWSRAVDQDRPVGNIVSSALKTALLTGLTEDHSDLDGIAGGLDFTTLAIDNAENRGDAGNEANDLIMSYVLFKVYGATNFNTANKVYNAADAKNMLTNEIVAEAVKDNIDVSGGSRAGPVDQMFRDLLAADPARFFTEGGLQETGLFETNTDVSGNGTWKITAGDIIELKLEFVFAAQVSRRVVSSQQQPTVEGATAEDVKEEVIIEAGDKFAVRLQLKATAEV
jgi:hypothetical protein